MKILMFGWEFPPHNSGGLGVACMGLTQALSKDGVEINFVLPNSTEVDISYMNFIFANVKVVGVRSLLTPYINPSSYMGLKRGGQTLYGESLFDEVARYAKEGGRLASALQFDAIHAHDWLSFGAGVEAKKVSGKPLVVHVHATEFDRTGGAGVNSDVYEVEKEAMNIADRVIAVSDFTKNIIVRHYDIDPKKIDVVHNGIEKSWYSFSNTPKLKGFLKLKAQGYKIVLFVGRITLQKGADYFLRAAKKCLEKDKKIIFVVAGSGDMERQVVNEAASLGIADKVFFAGFLRGEELSSMYKTADLFVMPSVSEPFGLTALESLIHKTPILISKQSGVSEVVRSALKCDFWDIDEMANKILATLSYKSLKKTLSRGGFSEAQKCTWQKAARKCERIYRQVLTK